MTIDRCTKALALGCLIAVVTGCETAPPPPVAVPASFRPLGLTAPYLMGDVIGGYRTRAAKMRAHTQPACKKQLAAVARGSVDRASHNHVGRLPLAGTEVVFARKV